VLGHSDPLAFLYSKDDFERSLLVAVAKKAYEYQQIRDKNLATFIAIEVSKLFKKG